MSINPLLSELGVTSADNPGLLQIEHRLLLSLTESLETLLLKPLCTTLTQSVRDVNRAVTVVGYAAAGYLVMAGVARIMEAWGSGRRRRRIGGGNGAGTGGGSTDGYLGDGW